MRSKIIGAMGVEMGAEMVCASAARKDREDLVLVWFGVSGRLVRIAVGNVCAAA